MIKSVKCLTGCVSCHKHSQEKQSRKEGRDTTNSSLLCCSALGTELAPGRQRCPFQVTAPKKLDPQNLRHRPTCHWPPPSSPRHSLPTVGNDEFPAGATLEDSPRWPITGRWQGAGSTPHSQVYHHC